MLFEVEHSSNMCVIDTYVNIQSHLKVYLSWAITSLQHTNLIKLH